MTASEKLRALDGAATKAPWTAQPSTPYRTINAVSGEGEFTLLELQYQAIMDFDHRDDGDVALIATLRNALPLIADVVKAAEETTTSWSNQPLRDLEAALTALTEHLEGGDVT